MAICEKTTFEMISWPERTTAAAVSSQEVSMPRMLMVDKGMLGCRIQCKLRAAPMLRGGPIASSGRRAPFVQLLCLPCLAVAPATAIASFVNRCGISPNRSPWTHASEPRLRGLRWTMSAKWAISNDRAAPGEDKFSCRAITLSFAGPARASLACGYCSGTSISFSSQCSVINSQRFLSPSSKSAVLGNTAFMTCARSFWTSTSASISR